MSDRRIMCLYQLKKYCDVNKYHHKELYILLGGCARSSKDISYDPETGEWSIWHCISDVQEEYKDDDTLKKEYPILFEAMEKGCLIKYKD